MQPDGNPIKTLISHSPDGREYTFNVVEETFPSVKGYLGIEFQLRAPEGRYAEFFSFKILFIGNDKILIYMVHNNYVPAVSGKGIIRAMTETIRGKYGRDIISSTRRDEYKIDMSEGRVPVMDKYWQRRRLQDPELVEYIVEEDRYIYRWRVETPKETKWGVFLMKIFNFFKSLNRK